MNRNGTNVIELHGRKQATKEGRMRVLITAILWGWKNETFSTTRRKRIVRAACCQEAYDLGYESKITCAMLPKWHIKLVKGIEKGDTQHSLSPKNIGLVKYCDKIESECIFCDVNNYFF